MNFTCYYTYSVFFLLLFQTRTIHTRVNVWLIYMLQLVCR